VSWLARYARSSIGAKHVMALTGVLMLAFAFVHMLGHLQMFGGQDMYNAYAHFLQDLWEVKWPVRLGLVGLLVVHVVFAIALVAKNRAARPVGYARYRPRVSSAVGRAMALSGLVVLAFLIFHILHFTLGGVQPKYFHVPDHEGRWDAYSMYVHAFRQPGMYVAYLVGIALLAAHLGHGASSWLQSLGLRHPKYEGDRLGTIVAAVLFVGYMVPPTAVLVHVIDYASA
jgi:succinate dehydrogenase / fumarate reductase cytochrome b subunit